MRRVALVGLGSGTMACYGRPDESWTFFEIDPVVARIARSPELFSYLDDCLPRTDVVLGDARLKIASAHEAEFDMIFIDAFSSDVVPVHLITREAVALYLTKLRSDGALIFHISNRFMDLTPVLSALASDANISGAVGDKDPDQAGVARMHASSRWVVLARDPALLTALLQINDWQSLSLFPPSRLWTDDFSDVLSTIRW